MPRDCAARERASRETHPSFIRLLEHLLGLASVRNISNYGSKADRSSARCLNREHVAYHPTGLLRLEVSNSHFGLRPPHLLSPGNQPFVNKLEVLWVEKVPDVHAFGLFYALQPDQSKSRVVNKNRFSIQIADPYELRTVLRQRYELVALLFGHASLGNILSDPEETGSRTIVLLQKCTREVNPNDRTIFTKVAFLYLEGFPLPPNKRLNQLLITITILRVSYL